MRTDSRRDFCRHAILAEGKTGLLIGPASHGKRAGIDHPVEWTIRASFHNGRPAILQFWIPVLVRERHFGFRDMPVRVPRLNHLRLQTDLVENSEQKLCNPYIGFYHVRLALI